MTEQQQGTTEQTEATRVFRAREAFSYDNPQGVPVVVRTNTLVTEHDQSYRHAPGLFDEVTSEQIAADRDAQVIRAARTPVVEQATAAPGELRAGPGRPAAAKKAAAAGRKG